MRPRLNREEICLHAKQHDCIAAIIKPNDLSGRVGTSTRVGENLSPYKCPLFEMRDALPKSMIGKVLRRELARIDATPDR